MSNKPAGRKLTLDVMNALTKMFGNEGKPDLPSLRSTFEAMLCLMKNAADDSAIMTQPTETYGSSAAIIVEPVAVKVKGLRSKTTFVHFPFCFFSFVYLSVFLFALFFFPLFLFFIVQ